MVLSQLTWTYPSDDASNVSTKPSPAANSGDCRIKGNISANGHIYHVPGSSHYDATIIDESKGERWFCTEEEAREALVYSANTA